MCVALMLGTGQDVKSRSGPCKFSLVVAYLVGVVLLNAYSGAYIALLATHEYKMPFTTLQGLLDNGQYELGTNGDGAVLSMFQNAERGVMKELYAKHMSPRMEDYPHNTLDGLRRICSSDKYAFITKYDTAVILTSSMNCPITVLPEIFSVSAFAFAFQKQSPYIKLFDHNFQKLRGSGLLQVLQQAAWPPQFTDPDPSVAPVTLVKVVPVLTLVVAGVLLAVVIVIIERIVYYIIQNKHHRLAAPLTSQKTGIDKFKYN